jgi:hypothetical protein
MARQRAVDLGRYVREVETTTHSTPHAQETPVPRPLSWRKALALPAVLSLALGSALFVAAPASAAADFEVLAPEAGAELDSRDVLFSGTALDGATVTVTDARGIAAPGTAPVEVVEGAWSVSATYPDDAPVEQSVTIAQSTDGLEDEIKTLEFTLPTAAAAPAEFDVTGPESGTTVESRDVVFTGTGTDDSIITVVDADGTTVALDATVVDGEWTTTAEYADDAPVDQSVTITQTTDGEPNGEKIVTFALPAAVEPEPEEDPEFAITSPEEGAELDSFDVTIEGTGTSGATVELSDSEGEPIVTDEPIVITEGLWSTTITYPEDADPVQFVDAFQLEGEDVTAETFTFFFLPFEYVDAPVITSPTEGQVIAGDQVTFAGTAEPGANLALLVIPTDELEEELGLAQRRLAAAAEPADPEDPIVVDENGEWSVTYELEPNEYTTAAILFDAETGFPTSDVSEFVSFSLIPAAAVDNPDEGTDDGAGEGDGEGLAVTGSESTGFMGLAAVLLVAGAALVVVNRRVARLEPARVDAARIE